MENINDYEILYKSVLSEEGMKVSDLPDGIRKKIRGFTPTFNNAKKDPDNDKKFQAVRRQDIEISKLIQDFIEKDIPEESEVERSIRVYLQQNDNKISEKMLRQLNGGRLPKMRGSTCMIGGIKLKRPFLTSIYKIVN